MINYEDRFSINLKNLRKSHGITQEQLANMLGYSKKTVSKWECSSGIPAIDTLFKLAKILKVNIEALFCESKKYFLGIDGGGTKTELAIADESGNILRTLRTDSCNPIDVGINNAQIILKSAIYDICNDIPFSSIVMYAGIAGGTTAVMQENQKSFFDKFGFLAFHNDSDIKLTISAGLEDRDGITLVMGTGICAFSRINGQDYKTAGWGYFFDEGGSAFNIGRDGLSAHFCALDGSGEKTMISEEIHNIYPHDPRSLIGYVYDGGKRAVASFATAVTAAYKKEDAVAKSILNRNMKCAAHVMETAAKRFQKAPIDVIIAGGLTEEPIIVELLKKHIEEPQKYKIKKLEKKPVIGAIKLAMKLSQEVENNA